MDIEQTTRLSRKSKGILYRLKDCLNRQKLTLQDHVCAVFGFLKTKFKLREFGLLIRTYDDKLVLQQIDQLFAELDESCNEVVFYEALKQAYEQISEEDNPHRASDQALEEAVRRSTGSTLNLRTLVEVYRQVRKALTQSEDIVEIIHLFALENQGFLTEANVVDIFNNIQFHDSQKRSLFLQSVFEGREKLPVTDFLEKVDLQQSARREPSLSVGPSPPPELNQSQFIKSRIRPDRRSSEQEDLFLKAQVASDGNDYIALEEVPEAVRPYYNYGSELQPLFCHFAEERLRNELIFIDPENPPYSQAFQWVHLAEKFGSYHLFQIAKSVLIRQKNRKGLGQLLEPKDIKQGSLGDCYFLSALAGVVEKYPELVYRLFVLEKNPSHLFGVRLFVEGAWRTVILDACFPVSRNGAFCGAQPHHQQIWVMLLEKAWAKVFGSYDNIHAGYNEEGLNALSGAPSIMVSSQENEFLKRVEVELRRGSIITCATSANVARMSKDEQERLGIFQNHAYSLLNVYSRLQTPQGSVTLLKVRNPWGRKEWQGDWSFASGRWTHKLRQDLDYLQNPQDGSFFISQSDFQFYFDHIHICRVHLANKNSWTQLENDREQFAALRLTVRQKGDYYFTAYQQNPRRYAGQNYEKSKSWLFLAQEEGGRRTAVGASCKERRDNTIEATLEPGTYLLGAKVQWKNWSRHSFRVASYGPERVGFEAVGWDVHMLSDFIESKAKLGFGKKSFYDNWNILKRVLFSIEEGYGFLLVNNQENVIFRLTIRFDNHKGLTILPPYSLPLTLQVFPGQEIICKFLVDPNGYAYSFRESYSYQPLP